MNPRLSAITAALLAASAALTQPARAGEAVLNQDGNCVVTTAQGRLTITERLIREAKTGTGHFTPEQKALIRSQQALIGSLPSDPRQACPTIQAWLSLQPGL